MLYVGMGWKGLGMMVIIGHRTFESTFGAIYINDNTCCASSNSRRFSLFFSIAPSVKKKLIRADWNFCSLQSIYESETCTCNTGAWEAIGSKRDRPFIFRLQPGVLKFVGLLCAFMRKVLTYSRILLASQQLQETFETAFTMPKESFLLRNQ